ncbi:hypothetical protein EU244_033530 [Rhodococcus qingshengii]|uniref:hypothetical protein n=1 Tax=Rhodococcus qingshengii TaxID=334542 RepID=UPI0010A620B4|nr:hypothetical protein [Rhodococcus qingshengii]THJ70183.1 hypothetical protein EU244_18080 [Rhodococcus qingshengii]
MHSSVTDSLLDRNIDSTRFVLRFRNGTISHDTLLERYQNVLTSPHASEQTVVLKKIYRKITKSSLSYQRYRVAAMIVAFVALVVALVARRFADEEPVSAGLYGVLGAVVVFVAWVVPYALRMCTEGWAMNNAQVADRMLANIESASGADVDAIRNDAIDSSVNGEAPQIRKDAGSSLMLRSLRFNEAVRTGAVTTAGLYDRYLDQLNHDDSADNARTLRAIRRHLAWTDVDRLRRVVIAAFATVSVLFVLTEVLAGQSAIFSLAAVVVSGLVLSALMRVEFGKSPLTGFATTLAIGQGRRADAQLRTLEETA